MDDLNIAMQACRNLTESPEARERQEHWRQFRAAIIREQAAFMALPKREQMRRVRAAKAAR